VYSFNIYINNLLFFLGAIQIDNNEVKIDMEEGITTEIINFLNDLFDSVK